MRLFALIALFLLAACASAPPQPAAARIDPVRMSNMVRTLASDEYEGRAPGTAGEAKTDRLYLPSSSGSPGSSRRARMAAGPRKCRWSGPSSPKAARSRSPRRADGWPLRVPDDVYLSTVRETDRARIDGRADGVRRLRSRGARAAVGRFQGRRPSGQGRRLPGQRSRFRGRRGRSGRRPVRRPGDDLLRPLDLQVRGSGAARRDRRPGRPRDRRAPATAGTRCRRPAARITTSC